MRRKDFIRSAVMTGAAFTIIPRHVLGGKGYVAPNDHLNLGYIGNGKQARGLLKAINNVPETIVAATCDVDKKKLDHFVTLAKAANAKKANADVTAYVHYRELLERKDIDAVIVATPDHWHAQIAIDAAKAGKDIYCEKPLALTIAEGRAMTDAVRKYKRVLQTGSMQRSQYNFRQAVELVLNGYIGQVEEINVSVGEPVKQCDLPSLPVPEYLDWNMWIGPSLYRGYNPTLSPPIEDNSWAWWRGYRGFGGGYITDWGAHMFDIVQWALDMDDSGPVAFNPPSAPAAQSGLSFTYVNGIVVNHKQWGEGNAIQFIGTEGTIEVSRSFLRSNPENIVKLQLKPSDKKVYHSENHYQDWITAIKKRTKPVADVEIGHRTATVCNAVNIAYELQRPLKWNPKKEKFDDDFANLMISRAYRAPWNFTDF
ncbi:Gfo/Idh/MocA family oxidoreductase [Agriterribacter sp.]|uniref:Gfo/Idh/MocA family protein n=1 Tax=Agriterribacter sp. TaxID=2821509 RepID=UPI002CB67523|nr:Gfo/Idh/MocA family oxidoreductase [Agriterribacter sp.]HRP54879.1 Gfo/Idh/MocA family oxidoreductase [Agriterribacter sp.]